MIQAAKLKRKYIWQGLLFGLPLVASFGVHADADDTFTLNAGINLQHDSNLFRLPSDADTQALLGTSTRSDLMTITSAGLKFNKQYSLQRFELDATMIDYRYRTFDHLDYTAFNYAGAWRWSVTPKLHGNLTLRRNESLNSYTDYSGYSVRNLRTEENQRFDGVYEIDGAWRLIGGISRSSTSNSQAVEQDSDTRSTSVDAGIRYSFPSGSALSYVVRAGHGKYTNRTQLNPWYQQDNAFDDYENELRLTWAVTGKTTIDTRLAHFSRKHEHYDDRDYSGVTGNININWQATGKTRITAGWTRELASSQSLSSSYVVTDRLSLAPYWQISDKTGLRLRYEYARRDYRGAIYPVLQDGRTDNVQNGQIALEWQPYRSLFITTSLQTDKRDSNTANRDYDSTMFNVSAQMSF